MRTIYFFLLAGLAACGSGGSAAPDPNAPIAEAQAMVVEYDQNDDGERDWVTLDTSTHPFRVVEAVHGSANGDPVDVTDILAGTSIDPGLSQALADHLARSFDVETRTELEVMLADGQRVSVTVLD
jgi:hypothetical protein